MGVLSTKKSLVQLEQLSTSSFCRRRLAVVTVRLKMAQSIKEAATYIEQGHIRVGPGMRSVLRSPACWPHAAAALRASRMSSGWWQRSLLDSTSFEQLCRGSTYRVCTAVCGPCSGLFTKLPADLCRPSTQGCTALSASKIFALAVGCAAETTTAAAAETVTDPAFLVTRNLEDHVTWVDTSKIRRKISKYNDKLDDYELLQ